MLSQPEGDQRPGSSTRLSRASVTAIALCLFVSACGGGGGGGSGSDATDGDLEAGSLWPQADSIPPGAFGSQLPTAVESVRYVFRSDTGYQCCVVIDPDELGDRAPVLKGIPAGPGTIQVSGYPTSFASAP